MADRWRIRGLEWTNCNCAFGCPCQFNAPSTHGHCEALTASLVHEGHFADVRLDGTRFVLLFRWPGEIAEGNGTCQLILDPGASAAQRDALRRITSGEDTAPGSTHFQVFASTCSRVLDPIVEPIQLAIDLEARTARLRVGDLIEAQGLPIVDPFGRGEFRGAIELANGFEFTRAEVGRGRTRARGGIALDLADSHAHLNVLHMNQDGVVR